MGMVDRIKEAKGTIHLEGIETPQRWDPTNKERKRKKK